MFRLLNDKYCLNLAVPKSIEDIVIPVTAMRHAFEHIDDRAQGRINESGETGIEALTIFEQPDFEHSSILRYAEHSLNFEEDVLIALLDARELVMEAIDARTVSQDENGPA